MAKRRHKKGPKVWYPVRKHQKPTGRLLAALWFFFPVQLIVNHIRRNPLLLLAWGILFAVVTGNFGKSLGITYLFLDPEYLNEVSFLSFAIIGVVLAGFTLAFHIASYISDSHRFSFLGFQPRPFTKFAINNSVIPVAFLLTYMVCIVRFQAGAEDHGLGYIAVRLAGLLTGYVVMTVAMVYYFRLTNVDFLRLLTKQLDDRLRRMVVNRVNVMDRLENARKQRPRIDAYLDLRLRFTHVEIPAGLSFDKKMVTQVFDQNQLNALILELAIFALLIGLGRLIDYPIFNCLQQPQA